MTYNPTRIFYKNSAVLHWTALTLVNYAVQ